MLNNDFDGDLALHWRFLIRGKCGAKSLGWSVDLLTTFWVVLSRRFAETRYKQQCLYNSIHYVVGTTDIKMITFDDLLMDTNDVFHMSLLIRKRRK